jgi:hypothetical protein
MKHLFLYMLLFSGMLNNIFAQDLKNGLIAYWDFEQSPDGRLGNLLVESHGVVFSPDTLHGNAVKFNEPGAHLTYKHGINLYNYFSIAFWIKPSAKEDLQTLIQQKYEKRQFSIQLKKQDLSVTLCDGINKATRIGIRHNFKQEQWAFVCVVMEGVFAHIYIDGKLEISSDQMVLNIRESQIADTLIFGNSTQKRSGFSGAIDEIAVYNRNLSAEEIQRIFEKEFPHFKSEEPTEEEPERDVIYKRLIEVQERITVIHKRLTIQFWDEGQEDDDRITLIFNDKKILSDYTLKKNKKEERTVEVRPGRNSLILIAENLGKIPPNTAIVMVYDGDKKSRLELKSDLDKSGAVEFIYEE